MSHFESNGSNILYHGDAVPSVGAIEMNKVNYVCRVGSPTYGHGLAFFLAPVGFEIPPNSAGGFLGLFNTTTSDSSQNQIVLVEFDSYVNVEWDPSVEHVEINNNSIYSVVYTTWNASLHSEDTADVWISTTLVLRI
ncbi:L-type lectin-domain containing receptor kinase IX.1-like [Fagus crenata]